MGISMRAIISMTRKMGKECICGNREIGTRVNLRMTTGTDMAKCTGGMAQVTKGNG